MSISTRHSAEAGNKFIWVVNLKGDASASLFYWRQGKLTDALDPAQASAARAQNLSYLAPSGVLPDYLFDSAPSSF